MSASESDGAGTTPEVPKAAWTSETLRGTEPMEEGAREPTWNAVDASGDGAAADAFADSGCCGVSVDDATSQVTVSPEGARSWCEPTLEGIMGMEDVGASTVSDGIDSMRGVGEGEREDRDEDDDMAEDTRWDT